MKILFVLSLLLFLSLQSKGQDYPLHEREAPETMESLGASDRDVDEFVRGDGQFGGVGDMEEEELESFGQEDDPILRDRDLYDDYPTRPEFPDDTIIPEQNENFNDLP